LHGKAMGKGFDGLNFPFYRINAWATLTLADVLQTALDAPAALPAADPSQPMTVSEVAEFLRVQPDKVLTWIRSGRLRGYNVAGGGRTAQAPGQPVRPGSLRPAAGAGPTGACGSASGFPFGPKEGAFLAPAGRNQACE